MTIFELHSALASTLASYRDEMAAFIEDLVRVPTENPPGRAYRECVDLLTGKLMALGFSCDVLDVPHVPRDGDKRSCIVSTLGRGGRPLYFHGHYDVVPASRPGQFDPIRQHDTIFGRGSSDMKSGLAAMLYAARALVDCGVTLNGRLVMVLVPDEETGGRRGTRYLAEQGLIEDEGVAMLMPEPTSGVVWHANRGALSLNVRVKGRPAHVGLHFEGVNAFEGMLRVADRLLALKGDIEQRATSCTIHPEAARRSILLLGGRTEGGVNFNAVPAECCFTVDRRINPEEDLDAERARLMRLFDELRREGLDLDVEVLQDEPASVTPTDTSAARALAASIEAVTGAPASFALCPGLLEIRFYRQRGVPAFAYGPGTLAVSHGPHEFVKLPRVIDCALIYALTAAAVMGG